MRLTFADTPNRKPALGEKPIPPAQTYLFPHKALGYFRFALLTALAVLLIFTADLFFGNGKTVLPGPLASSHANFGNDCAKCHTTFGQVEDAKCSACHEKSSGQFAVGSNQYPNIQISKYPKYSFQSHYIYRSDSLTRSRSARVRHNEQPCRVCHLEHRGHDTKLAAVTNAACANCHFENFTKHHPEFQFARTQTPDDSTLKFTHIKHVAELRKLSRAQYPNTQATCSYCHEPEPDGKLFKPISFDRHCNACHLVNTLTPPLPLAAKNNGAGVHTLEELLARNEVATQWAHVANPNDFRLAGETRLIKRVAHRDPWMLWHLEQGTEGKAQRAGGNESVIENKFTNIHYALAILRMTPDKNLHAQLARADTVLRRLQASALPIPHPNPSISPALNPLAEKIAKPCVECHYLSGPGVLAVNGEQEVLRRANFDHSAHLVQSQCLDCHVKIDVEKVGADSLLAVRRDRASVQNLPEIAKCRQCHAEEKAAVDCARCHEFHP